MNPGKAPDRANDNKVITFRHPAPPLDFVQDSRHGKGAIFSPDCAEGSGQWIEADIGCFVPRRLAL